MDTALNPRAVAGNNNPPPDPTPYEVALREVSDLYEEAAAYLDGEPIETQGQADDIAKLLNLIREARQRADEARKVEKRPHDEAVAEVQARYKPILASADLATGACKQALAPWLAKVAEEQKAEAERIRSEAEHARMLAQEAMQSSDVTNLAERARAETLVVEAQRVERQAARAEKAKPQAGHFGKAVGLRTTYAGAIVNETECAGHYWRTDRVSMLNAVQALVDQDVRAGVRQIPGVRIDAVKKAV